MTERLWVYDSARGMVQRDCNYVPGLYKIFDEILVNAADNKQRDPNMDTIRVEIDAAAGTIAVHNNGTAVPVQIHADEQVYVPELIFGHLLTGSNFDDVELKVTGGRNGYGAKLANIFSVRAGCARAVRTMLHEARRCAAHRRSLRWRPRTGAAASGTVKHSLTT